MSPDDRLKRLTAELQAIFELSPDGFISFNEDGVRSYVNPALARMIGYTRDQLLDISMGEFETLLLGLCRDGKTEANVGNGELLYLTRPAKSVLKRQIRRAEDADGRFIGTIQYFQDITHEMELEKMKSDFLSMAAHELRTPMSSIHGFTELLLKRSFDPIQQHDMLQTIYRQTSRLTDMINDLLDLARIDARGANLLSLRPQSLERIVASAIKDFHPDSQIHYQINIPKEKLACQVMADAPKLTRVITNVLSNAYKYSPKNTSIQVEVMMDEKTERIGVIIRDQGVGMHPAQLARIFDRFYRVETSGSTPGTGLGMCLVKEIVELHGGLVDVESKYGHGTTVTLWLPLL